MNRRCRALLAIGLAVLVHRAAAQIALPIYIEDNHAGSFYWLAEHLDLDEPVTLLHFDAHNDASAIFDSDKIRTQLRRVASVAERRELLEKWRERGTVQCFNWIEPLMPAPFKRVIWVPGDNAPAAAEQMRKEAADYFDGHLEAAQRHTGSFRERVAVRSLEDLVRNYDVAGPVVVTIDLDYFADVMPGDRAAAFERVWKFVSERRNLRAVTFAISRPYLRSDEDADALVQLALRGALSLPTARVEFGAFRHVGNERSLRATELRAAGEAVPSLDLTKASPPLRALLLANRSRIRVTGDAAGWDELRTAWRAEAPALHVGLQDRQPSTDGIWRVRHDESAKLEVRAQPWYAAVAAVEWIVEIPVYRRCNLISQSDGEIGFAQGAPPRPRWRDVLLPGVGGELSLGELQQYFDPQSGCGALRIRARAMVDGTLRETPPIEVRRFRGTGFRAALTEQFGLPYLYGSGELRDRANTGPETGWGADCANFLVAALRRQGLRIPWSNPRQFRRYLEPVAQDVRIGDAPAVSASDFERGLFLHFGSHVAAMVEDLAPVGQLSGNDVVAHQLEGTPELIPVEDLLQQRGEETFDLLRTPPSPPQIDLVIGGDVMLGRGVEDQIKRGIDPLAGLREVLARASARAINLECVISDAGIPAPGKRYTLRAPADALTTLVGAGIGVVGTANNHALDFGPSALVDSIARLREAGCAVIGAGSERSEAYAPHVVTTATGKRIALLALSDVETGRDAQSASASIATATDRRAVAHAVREARSAADVVVVMVHWGDESTSVVTERQRELARWLVNEGVDVIAGSHPHCVQPLDFYHGRPIAYSLGNLVFDGAPTVPGWNEGELLNITVDRSRNAASVTTLPIHLDRRGFPSTVAPSR